MQRLDRFEREHRRLKRLGSVVLVGLAAVVLMGQAKPNAVKGAEVELFVMPDARGKVHVGLAVGREDSTRLLLSERRGKPRIGVAVPTSPARQGRETPRRAERGTSEEEDP